MLSRGPTLNGMWTHRLTTGQAEQVLALAGRAARVDDVAPLNEEAGFALRDGTGEHLLEFDADTLAGYLLFDPRYRTAQLVVDPDHRRQGVATRLHAALGGRPALGTWAFGDLPAAQGFAAARDLHPVRALLMMARPLDDAAMPQVPGGLTLRGWRSGDADAVLALNAAAFAHHREQGSLDATGLAERMSEPWFDPEGLILAFDAEGLAGFHWTKRIDDRTGEVYVIATAPRVQGRGYGRVLLAAGLSHLSRAGARRVVLYVDSAETIPVRMYESAGFAVAHRDVLYAPVQVEQS